MRAHRVGHARCNASTDVTGFGLLGHLAEMLGGNHGAILNTDTIPVLEAASVLPQEVGRTHWIDSNRAYVSRLRRLVADCDATRLTPLLDPQTNGGLLVAVDPARVPALAWQGFTAIGRIVEGNTIHVQ